MPGRRQVQYQERAEAISQETAPLDWLVQHPQPVMTHRRPSLVPEAFAFVEDFAAVLPSIDWFQQRPELVRDRPHTVREGGVSFVETTTPTPTDLDWWVQQPELVRDRPHTIRQGGAVMGQPPITPIGILSNTTVVYGARTTLYQAKAEPVFVEEVVVVPDFGWSVQPTDQLRGKHTVREGGEARQEFTTPTPVDFTWWVQHPELIHGRPHTVREGGAVMGQPPIAPFTIATNTTVVYRGRTVIYQAKAEPVFVEEVVVVPDFGWSVQPAAQHPRKHVTREGGMATMVEFGVPVPAVDLDWFVQNPEMVRDRPHTVRPGWVAFVETTTPTPTDLDWFVQNPEFVRDRPHTVGQGGPAVFVHITTPTPVDFDWWVQHPEYIQRARHMVREGGMAEFGRQVVILVAFDMNASHTPTIDDRLASHTPIVQANASHTPQADLEGSFPT